MYKLKSIIQKIISVICVILMAALTIIVAYQVFARKVLNNPSGITEELAQITFVWTVLFSAAYLFGERNGHMNVGLLPEKAKGKFKIVLRILSDIGIILFAGFVLVNGGMLAVKNGLTQNNAAMPWLSNGVIYSALPICGVITIFNTLVFLVEDLKLLFTDEILEEVREEG